MHEVKNPFNIHSGLNVKPFGLALMALAKIESKKAFWSIYAILQVIDQTQRFKGTSTENKTMASPSIRKMKVFSILLNPYASCKDTMTSLWRWVSTKNSISITHGLSVCGYLRVCVWAWLVQTDKILAGLSSSLCVFSDPMQNLVHSQESRPDWTSPLSVEHARSFLRDVDCAWSPRKHGKLSSWQQAWCSKRNEKPSITLLSIILWFRV